VVLYHLWTSKPPCCFIMGSPPNKGWGLRGSRSARSEPQHAWDSFLLASSVLEASTGGTRFRSERVSVPLVEVGVERSMPEGGMLETTPPQERTPWRRGRPRKDMGKKEEDRPPAELSVHPAAEGSMMLTNWSRPVGTTSKGSGG
jgi:hypothetical protein